MKLCFAYKLRETEKCLYFHLIFEWPSWHFACQENEHRQLKTTDKIIIYSGQEPTLSYMSSFQHTSRDKYSFLLVALVEFDGWYLQYMDWTNEVVVGKEVCSKRSWGFLCFHLSFLSSFRSIVFSLVLREKERKVSLGKSKKKDDSQE